MRGEKAVSSQIGSRDWTVIERESDEEKRTVNRGQKMAIEGERKKVGTEKEREDRRLI